MTSALFEISCGRRIMYFLYLSMSLKKRAMPSGDGEKAVPDAKLSLPASMRSSMPSWMTSV